MVAKSTEELWSALDEQVDFLQASCERFDEGHPHEAKRMAVAIRVLVYDHPGRGRNPGSVSLLTQLGVKNRWLFLDSAGPVNPRNRASTINLLWARSTHLGNNEWVTEWQPRLGDGPPDPEAMKGRQFHDWWTMTVVRDHQPEDFSRQDLVRALANREGGAHIDPKTKDRDAALARSHTLGYSFAVDDREFPPGNDPILPCVRQIAYEVIETVNTKMPVPERGPVSGQTAPFGPDPASS